MEAFTTLSAIAVPLDEANIDTNQLCPTRFNKLPDGPEMASVLFHDLRFDSDGEERPEFILNRLPYRNAGIIVADRNFGCGSSRESAVYALKAFGIRAVIAPSFGDIFAGNCFRNGLLPVVVPDTTAMRQQIHAEVGAAIGIDLPAQIVTGPDGIATRFDIHPLRKQCLVEGLDDIRLTIGYRDRIAAFEKQHHAARPYLAPIRGM